MLIAMGHAITVGLITLGGVAVAAGAVIATFTGSRRIDG